MRVGRKLEVNKMRLNLHDQKRKPMASAGRARSTTSTPAYTRAKPSSSSQATSRNRSSNSWRPAGTTRRGAVARSAFGNRGGGSKSVSFNTPQNTGVGRGSSTQNKARRGRKSGQSGWKPNAPGGFQRPGQPRCYQCGQVGHWANACPSRMVIDTAATLLATALGVRSADGGTAPPSGPPRSDTTRSR